MNDLRRGSQQPTLLREPPDAVDWRLSDIAVDWAREVAGYLLDEWQAWLVRWTFARRADGLWAARDVGAEVPRQNGKNVWLEVVELVSVFEFGDRLITHSAHRADLSHEHFVEVKGRIEASDDLMDLMPARANRGFVTSHGLESIELKSGARILFKARANSSGRGPRPQKVVFDEALILEHGQIGAMVPGIAAQRNPQLLFASSPPKVNSPMLHSLRKRAADPSPGDRLFYAAWNNPKGTPVEDRDSWYRVNPSLGYGRMTEESLMANRNTMPEAEFLREHMGIPEDPPEEGDGIVAAAVWDALVDSRSEVASHRCMALDVSPDLKWAAIGGAGRRADGLLHVETVHHEPRTNWVKAEVLRRWTATRVPIRIQRGAPAEAFVAPLRELGVEVVEVTAGEHAQALGQFLMAVNDGELRHLGQTSLTSALMAATVRPSGDVDLWARRSASDISPLVAVTVALGGVPEPAPVGPAGFIDLSEWDDEE